MPWFREGAGLLPGLLAVALSATCAARTTEPATAAPVQGAPVAPNESIVTGDVLEAVVVDSTTIEIEPPQPILVLTLKVASVSGDGGPKAGTELEVLSKETKLTSLEGRQVTVAISLRGSARSARYWLVRVVETTSPR